MGRDVSGTSGKAPRAICMPHWASELKPDHEAQVFGQGINYFHIENLKLSHFAIRASLEIDRVTNRRGQEERRARLK